MKRIRGLLPLLIVLLLVLGCGGSKTVENSLPGTSTTAKATTTTTASTTTVTTTTTITTTATATTAVTTTVSQTQGATQAATQSYKYIPDVNRVQTGQGRLIAIDAGHQRSGNNEKEPIGPGAGEMKAKVTTGTTGCVTGMAESELNLAVALKLRDELKSRGYEVLMIRESQDVNLSNAERAQMANNAGAQAFVRIHADGVENSTVKGASVLCQTSTNPYNGQLYAKSRRLSECILNEMTAETGGKKRSVMETDTMSGINWCMVPVTIVEMGFMSNPEEDALMATEEYQWKIARGIADGLDAYFLN